MTIHGELPVVVDGSVRPWAISVGHSKLLLRGLIGDPESEDPPRVVDILFQDVSRISLSDLYRGIELRLASDEELAAEADRLGCSWPGSKMFLVHPANPRDYVVAGVVYWAEVSVPPGFPSPLLAEDPADEGIPDVVYFA